MGLFQLMDMDTHLRSTKLHLNKPADFWKNDETRDQDHVWRRPNMATIMGSCRNIVRTLLEDCWNLAEMLEGHCWNIGSQSGWSRLTMGLNCSARSRSLLEHRSWSLETEELGWLVVSRSNHGPQLVSWLAGQSLEGPFVGDDEANLVRRSVSRWTSL